MLFPQQVGLASAEHARVALDTLERGWVNQWGGVHTREPDITSQGSGVVTTALFAKAFLQHGRIDSGWSLLQKAASAPFQDRMLGAFVEVIPPNGASLIQLWSVGPFLEAIIEGLAGVRPNAAAHRITLSLGLPAALDHYELSGLEVGTHVLDIANRRDGAIQTKTVSHVRGDQPLTATIACPGSAAWEVELNGVAVLPRPTCSTSQEASLGTFEIVLPSGTTLAIASRRVP